MDVAGDADSALALISVDADHTMIMTDYRLPGALIGIEFAEATTVVARRPLNACVVIGDPDPKIISAAAERGIPLIHKSIHPARLRALIAHLTTSEK